MGSNIDLSPPCDKNRRITDGLCIFFFRRLQLVLYALAMSTYAHHQITAQQRVDTRGLAKRPRQSHSAADIQFPEDTVQLELDRAPRATKALSDLVVVKPLDR